MRIEITKRFLLVALFSTLVFTDGNGVEKQEVTLHQWKNLEGRTIEAEFLGADADTVTILFNGQKFVLKLNDLAKESQTLAHKLSVPPDPPPVRDAPTIDASNIIESFEIPDLNPSDAGYGQWEAKYGSVIKDMKQWGVNNPMPYTGYFPHSIVDKMQNWHISLGPLGVNTLMHDRSWTDAFAACNKLAPIELMDECGQIKNAYEVTIVKPGGPAEGILKEGDLILRMDGQDLKEAQLTYLGTPLGYKDVRGLGISAGQMIDKAEGRGKINLTILRVPQNQKQELQNTLKDLRSWQMFKTIKRGNFDVMLENVDMIKFQFPKGSKVANLSLSNASGLSFPLTASAKKGRINDVSISIPRGQWQLRGTAETTKSAVVKISAVSPVNLPSSFDKYIIEVELELPKIGSFGDKFDPHGEKARNYSNILAHRLAGQQQLNGSWSGRKSYGSNTFYTSICALGLMSTGNPQYQSHIRNAAHYVANATWGKWTYIAGMRLTFLSEYYLRTKDKSIIPGLKLHIAEAHAFVLGDYTAGHSRNKPGYGGGGWIGGGGMIACGLATASHTGLTSTEDEMLLDKMLERAQQLAPGGKIPYARGGGSTTELVKDQKGGCATGPYFFASLIRGGTDHFTRAAARRYGTAPWGTAEGGHATQTLHFVWGALASANCGNKALRGCMDSYIWKFVLLRNFDGLISNNNYRTEYHGGDGVIGAPYWRTGGYLLLMNAAMRNLAITGSTEYRAKEFKKAPMVFFAHQKLYNYVQRSWFVAESALGSHVPQSLKSGIEKLNALPKDAQLGENVRKLLIGYAPRIAKDILALERTVKGVNVSLLVETIYGVSFEASCTPDFATENDSYSGGAAAKAEIEAEEKSNKSAGKAAKRQAERTRQQKLETMTETEKQAFITAEESAQKAVAEKATAEKKDTKKKKKQTQKSIAAGESVESEYIIKFQPVALLSKEGIDKKVSIFDAAFFEFSDVDVTITDPTGKYFEKPLPIKPTAESPQFIHNFPMKTTDTGAFDVAVNYKLNGHHLSYNTKLHYPSLEIRKYVPSLNRITVKGTVTEDYRGNYTCRVKLDTGRIAGCEQPYGVGVILAGTPCEFEISPTAKWAHNIRSVKKLKCNNRIAIPDKVKIEGVSFIGDPKVLTDADPSTAILFNTGEAKKKRNRPDPKATITYTFARPVEITSGIFSISTKGIGEVSYTVQALIKGQWQPIRENYQFEYFNTLFAESNQFRITFPVPAKSLNLAEFTLHTAPVKRSAEQIKQEYTW